MGGWCRLARVLPLQEWSPLQVAVLAAWLPLAASQRAAAPCYLAAGGCPLRPGPGRCLRPQVPPLQAPAMPAGGHACWRLPLQGALAVAGRPLVGGHGHSRLPLAAGLAMGGRCCMGADRGWLPLLLAAFTTKTWLATARPPAGEPVMAWLPTRGGHPRARPAAASPAASRGGDAGRRGGCPLVGRLPVAKGSRRFRRGSDYGGEVRVKEG
ncbi:hypothetical protein BHE74_00054957 [Ensete ventricosum]|nr:hypothetical protein BHE74_00054957 [Ensete ventricosum]